MKIAIHLRKGCFAERWVDYCRKNNIEYKIVNAYDNDIVEQVKGCDAFMWHFHHLDYRDAVFAKSLLFSLRKIGMKVFPDFDTCWHFDDKVAQKYLLEAVGAPLVTSYVFYSECDAKDWVERTEFPKVFKLRGGAGASNVKLVKTKKDALKLISRAFGRGFKQQRIADLLREEYIKYKKGHFTLWEYIRIAFGRIRRGPTEYDRFHGREVGYAYFQDFIPGNTFDIRVCVVGDKAFGLKRYTRDNDFRASGSGNISYAKGEIDERCVKLAFDIAKKLGTQSVAFDFIFNVDNEPMVVEISYGYAVAAYDACEGYWTDDMQWHSGSEFDFCGWIVDNLLNR